MSYRELVSRHKIATNSFEPFQSYFHAGTLKDFEHLAEFARLGTYIEYDLFGIEVDLTIFERQ